jgi:hypothetical protein
MSADTMVDAIALSSPSGRMSKRARKAAEERLANALFGPGSGFAGFNPPKTDEQKRRDRIVQLRSRLADCQRFYSFQPRSRKWPREIAAIMAELAELESVECES